VSGAVLVVKFGGELLDQPAHLDGVVAAMRAASERRPVVIVHGGGKEIDAALRTAGIEKRQVDGLRITDDATLDVVVGVLAGNVNTRVTAALCRAGVRAVGLTGADGSCGLADPAPPHRAVDGRLVDLGRVGIPSRNADVTLVRTLCDAGFVPVIASIGVTEDGGLLNVNADTFAGRLAERLNAQRLVVAGTTPGVLDDRGETLGAIDSSDIERLIGSGTATAGMIAKLRACQDAVGHGVGDVVIVDGRDRQALEAAALDAAPASATRIAAVGYAGRTSSGG
jgi:acetylglutamate kinase